MFLIWINDTNDPQHKCSFKYFHLQEDVPVCFKSFPLWLKNFNKSLGVVYCFYINKTNLLKKLFEKKEKKMLQKL